MKGLLRRRLVWAATALLVLVAAVLLTSPCCYIISGFLRGESTYQGRPTTYWREALIAEGRKLEGKPRWYDRWLERLGISRPGSFVDFHPGPEMSDGVPPVGSAVNMFGSDPAAVPVLAELLRDEDARIRAAACHALARSGLAARHIVRPLAEALYDSEVGIRLEAVEALAAFGPEAKPAVPGLIHVLEDRPADGRLMEHRARVAVRAAALALKKIDAEAAQQAGID
jgi:HEAT repeats